MELFVWSVLSLQVQTNERYIEVTGASEIEIVPGKIHYVTDIREYFEEYKSCRKSVFNYVLMTAASREMLDEPPISHKKNYTANFTFILLPGLLYRSSVQIS